MPINPNSEKGITRLYEQIRWNREQLEPFQEIRDDLRKQFVGRMYGAHKDTGEYDKDAVNMTELFVNTSTRLVAANNPRVLVTPSRQQLSATAASFEAATNKQIAEMDLKRTLRRGFKESLIGLGAVVTGITDETDDRAAGEPYADCLALKDMLIDMTADDWEAVELIGHRYRVPRDLLLESSRYPTDVAEKIPPTRTYGSTSGSMDAVEGDKELELSHDDTGIQYREYIDLWDIWLRWLDVIVTIPCEGPQKALLVQERFGIENLTGNYHLLGHIDVPGSLMPLAPAAVGYDQADFVNRLYRRNNRRAEQQKNVPWYTGDSADDMQRAINANDMEAIRVDNANAIGNLAFPGTNPQDIAIALNAKRTYNETMGNPELLAGLSSGEPTLGQEENRMGAASGRVNDMEQNFHDWTRSIVQSIAWYLWKESDIVDIPITKPTGIGNQTIDTFLSPDDKEGDFIQYELNIDPYSMRHRTPGQKAAAINQTLQTVLTLGGQFLQQQGATVDMKEYVDTIAHYNNVPELAEIVRFATPTERQRQQELASMGENQQGGKVATNINERAPRQQKDHEEDTIMRLAQAGSPAEGGGY